MRPVPKISFLCLARIHKGGGRLLSRHPRLVRFRTIARLSLYSEGAPQYSIRERPASLLSVHAQRYGLRSIPAAYAKTQLRPVLKTFAQESYRRSRDIFHPDRTAEPALFVHARRHKAGPKSKTLVLLRFPRQLGQVLRDRLSGLVVLRVAWRPARTETWT